ncbi:hypothetical protein [Granulicella tundricola]|uniref:Pappalysin-1 SD scarf domain-containing protein n=1 Tax=Granulicella tundricola (strain ATCC BAA-1859 / DSM 23138 / MP5ACTX9) TaxID=1198114 RepID=E8X2C8_GRATM|nr:hypothetical protein [Granulicella tundricola]ADW68060.1 hypothetical protein AciX9_0993 [Granulicella tundricola MP5ACTX9]
MKTLSAHSLLSAALLSFALSGCKKTPAPPAPAPVAAAPAPTPAPTPASTPAATPEAAAAPGATVSDPVTANGVTTQSTLGTGKTVEWALKQGEIKDDPSGQWPSAATASSAYNDAKDQQRFAPWQATGVPNVDQAGDNANAWDPKTPDGGIEWLDLLYPKPMPATGVRIRESANGGAVVKVDLIDEDNHLHPLWSGTDPTKALNYFMLTFPKTTYKVSHVKITLATNLIPGENEIDAVQLVSSEK